MLFSPFLSGYKHARTTELPQQRSSSVATQQTTVSSIPSHPSTAGVSNHHLLKSSFYFDMRNNGYRCDLFFKPKRLFCIMLTVINWRRQWHPTPVLLPGKSHGQKRLVGYSPRGCKEPDMTEHARRREAMIDA